MANPLTGDFDAVLQISGSTVNRLLASMHQNGFSNPQLPSFAHSVALRIGDGYALEGVRGSARVQIGAPRISLIHGVTDRFRLEVDIRARYKADPDTTPLGEFIHGVVTAEYRLTDIDPTCPGWRNRAQDYLWIRVVEDSVRFEGTAIDARGLLYAILPDPGRIPRITRQIARLLSRDFVASPHPVSKRFRKGAVRSLVAGAESGACIAVPAGNEPFGNIASVPQLFLSGSDLALAISSNTLLRLAAPAAANIASQRPAFKVRTEIDYLFDTTVYEAHYSVVIQPPGLQWLAFGSHAIFRLTTTAFAKTPSKLFPDFEINISQDLVIAFDAGSQRLILSEGGHSITVHSSFPIPQSAIDNVAATVAGVVKKSVAAAIASTQPSADALTANNSELIAQLRTFDAEAGLRYDSASFLASGIVLRGPVYLSRRKPPVAEYGSLADTEGYTAFTSWVPGGRIDEFRWSWSWYGAGTPGSANLTDRFILQRPIVSNKWGGGSKFGQLTLEERKPLPGLDGMGRICVELRGSHADPVTGALVPSLTRSACHRFGFPIYTKPGLFWRYREPLLVQDVPFPELAVLDVSALPGRPSNMLLLNPAGEWNSRYEENLIEALRSASRDDAGLAVVVILPDGALAADSEIMQRIESVSEWAGATVLVNEDVMGSWSNAFAFRRGEDSWRLVSPGGGVTWMHDGEMRSRDLAWVLDQGLFPSGPPLPAPANPLLTPGKLLPIGSIYADLGEMAYQDPCPPNPKGRLGGIRQTVTGFALAGSAASQAKMAAWNELALQGGEDAPEVLVVLSGKEEPKKDDGCGCAPTRGATIIRDPDFAIARRLGVSMWPTTLTLNPKDVIVKAEFGLAGREN